MFRVGFLSAWTGRNYRSSQRGHGYPTAGVVELVHHNTIPKTGSQTAISHIKLKLRIWVWTEIVFDLSLLPETTVHGSKRLCNMWNWDFKCYVHFSSDVGLVIYNGFESNFKCSYKNISLPDCSWSFSNAKYKWNICVLILVGTFSKTVCYMRVRRFTREVSSW